MAQLRKHRLTEIERSRLKHAYHPYPEIMRIAKNLDVGEYIGMTSSSNVLLLQSIEALQRRGLDLNGQTIQGDSKYGFRIILPSERKSQGDRTHYFGEPIQYYFNKRIKNPEVRIFRRRAA